MLEIMRSRNLQGSGHGVWPGAKWSWMAVSPDGREQPKLGTHVLSEGGGMTGSGLGGWREVGPEQA